MAYLGVSDAHTAEKPEALNLAAEGCVSGNHELVPGLLRDELVEAFVGFQVVLVFSERRASRRRFEVADSLFEFREPLRV